MFTNIIAEFIKEIKTLKNAYFIVALTDKI